MRAAQSISSRFLTLAVPKTGRSIWVSASFGKNLKLLSSRLGTLVYEGSFIFFTMTDFGTDSNEETDDESWETIKLSMTLEIF